MPEDAESAERIAALEAEIAQLRNALTAHAAVDQAMGVVIAFTRSTPETAWEILKEVSQHTNTKLRVVAEHIRQWPHHGRLPDDVRHALDTAVRARGPRAPWATDGARGRTGRACR
ncbi:ANTAR domain-containing protein [Streptomyces sp. NPDC000983]|uniref:ANTAR domain-containing protein n=1 Tax=Streptomyces sp. NPDC000983 TaxID=3154373 RepID=UPI0033203D27